MPELAPIFGEADQPVVDGSKPGVFAPERLPELLTEEFYNGLQWICFSGTATIQTGEYGHPGIVRLTTGTTINDKAIIGLHDSVSVKPLWTPNVVTALCSIRIPTATSTRFNIGFYGDALTTTNFGNDSLCFEMDTSVAQVFALRANNAGAATRLASTNTVSSNVWYRMDMYRDAVGEFRFYVNNALIGTITSNVPTGACGVGMTIETLTGAARSVDIDLFKCEQYVIQRFD